MTVVQNNLLSKQYEIPCSPDWGSPSDIGGTTPAAGIFTALSVTTSIATTDKTPVNAVASEGKLTSAGALAPATHATSEIVSDATAPADGDTVTIDTKVYTFKTTLTPTEGEVLIGVSAAVALDNLKAAINHTGTPDTDYKCAAAHPDVVATGNTNTVQTILAKVPGVTPNAYATTEVSGHLSWADTTLGGGTGNSTPGVTTAYATITINSRVYTFVDALSEDEADAIVDQILYGGSEAVALDNMLVAINAGATAGTNYSTGTIVNADVAATTNTATTQVIQAKVKGVAGDLITTTETLANTTWDDVTLGTEVAGVDGTVGVANEITQDADYFYVCLATNTVAGANWRRIAVGAVY